MEVKNGVVVWSSKIVIKLATVIFNKENIFKPALYDHDLKKKIFFGLLVHITMKILGFKV